MSVGVFLLSLISCLVSFSVAYSADTTNPQSDSWGVNPFPVIMYSPETKVGLGVGAVGTRPKKSFYGPTKDSFSAFFLITTRQQLTLPLDYRLALSDSKWTHSGTFLAQKFPSRFWGLGPYTPDKNEEYYTNLGFFWIPGFDYEVIENLRVGVRVNFRTTRILKRDTFGELENTNITGRDGGLTFGLGPMIEWDDRDNRFYPKSGHYARFTFENYEKGFLSDYSFTRIALTLKYFREIVPNHILGFHVAASDSEGSVPFFMLPLMRLRGLVIGRFIDEAFIMGETEYRFPIYKKFSGTTFIGAGNVAKNISAVDLGHPKYGGGFGIRYAIREEDKMNIRLDFSYSPWGYAPYFQVMEAF